MDHQLPYTTKPTSSEVAYSNQSTRTLITTPLQTYIVSIVTSGYRNSSINIFLQQDQTEWMNRNHFLISREDVV